MPLGPYFIAIMHFNMGSGVIEVFHCILLLHIDAKVEAKSFYFRSVANKPVAAVKIKSNILRDAAYHHRLARELTPFGVKT